MPDWIVITLQRPGYTGLPIASGKNMELGMHRHVIETVVIRVSLAMLLFAEIGPHPLAGQEPVYRFSTTVFGTSVVIPAGLKGLVYELESGTTQLPDFESIRPVATIYTTTLNIPPQDFMEGFPGVSSRFEWFAIDYTGNFWIAKRGKYKFALNSDDGSKLYIDDALIIDNDGQHVPMSKKGSTKLAVGVHRIRISYFQGPRFTVALTLHFAGPSGKWHLFSTDEFKPPPDSGVWSSPTRLGH
jgi:PA14 domain